MIHSTARIDSEARQGTVLNHIFICIHPPIVRHLYFPCIRVGMPKTGATFMVFFFSAVMHEMLISVRKNYFVVFFFFSHVILNICKYGIGTVQIRIVLAHSLTHELHSSSAPLNMTDSLPHDSVIQLSRNDEVSRGLGLASRQLDGVKRRPLSCATLTCCELFFLYVSIAKFLS